MSGSKRVGFVALWIVGLSSLSTTAGAAAPATRPAAASPQNELQRVRAETWEQDNARLRAQAARLAAKVAELEKRPAPATRPAPVTAPTSRPVVQLAAENKRLVGTVNAMLERIALKSGRPPLSKGVSELTISFSCQGSTIDDFSELLGMTGQLASERDDGALRYEWQFKILDDTGRRVVAVQPFVCEVVDGKIVSNQMLEPRAIGSAARRDPGAGAAKLRR